MNNFSAKNIVYNLTKNKDMPYQETNDISLKANQIIYTSVNNNFQKMVNNDLYIQKQLLDKQNFIEGPKLSSYSKVRSAENGYKIWDPSIHDTTATKISILQKEIKPVIDTLTKTECATEPVANIAFNDGNFGTLIGATDGLYKIDTSYKSAQKVSKELGSVVSSTKTNDSTIIATTNGIWSLSNSEANIHKISDINDSNDILYLSGEILRCTDSGMYKHEYSDDNLLDKSKLPGLTEKTYSTNASDDGTVVAATETGIYEGKKEYTISQTGSQVVVDGEISKIFKFNGSLFVLTSTGLYLVNGTTVSEVLKSSDINSVKQIDNDLYVAVGGNSGFKGLRKYNSATSSTDETSITTAAQDVFKYQGNYFVSTSNGIVYTQDLSKSESTKQVSGSNKGIEQFATTGNVLYCSDGTKNLKSIIGISTEDLSVVFSDSILDIFRNEDECYFASKNGIYNQNLNKIYTFTPEITRCKFIKVQNTALDGVYAMTDNGIIYCSEDAAVVESSNSEIVDSKSTNIYLFKLNTNGDLYFTSDTSKSFWDDTITWRSLASGVSQIETIDSKAYFIKGGKLLVQEPNTTAYVDACSYLTQYIHGFSDMNLHDTDSTILSDMITFFYGKNKTYGLSSDQVSKQRCAVEMNTLQTTYDISGEILKTYANMDVSAFVNGSHPRMPYDLNGMSLRDLNNYCEILRINENGIDSIILSSCNIYDGRIMNQQSYYHDEKFNGMLQYKDNSRDRGFQDDNYTFFTSKSTSGYNLKYSKPIMQNDRYAFSTSDISYAKLLPLPENVKNVYLCKFRPEMILYSNSKAECISSNYEGYEKNPGVFTLTPSGSGTYKGHTEDSEWEKVETTIAIEGEDSYPISAYVRGMYHLFTNGLYKTFYTIIANREDGKEYDSYIPYFLNTKITTSPITSIPKQYQTATKVCTLPTTPTEGSKVMENGTYTYYSVPETTSGAKNGKLYYQECSLNNLGSTWTASTISSKLKFKDCEICEGNGYFLSSDSSNSYVAIIDQINKYVASESPVYTVTKLLITPTGIQSAHLNGYPVVFIRNSTNIYYIEPKSTQSRKVTKLDLPTSAPIKNIYKFYVCNEERICITNSMGYVYEIRYTESKGIEIEERTANVSMSDTQQLFQFDDSDFKYLGPKFDITTNLIAVYINGFKTDYSDSNLTNVLTTSGRMTVTDSYDSSSKSTTLYVSNGNELRRNTIDPEIQFSEQIEDFDSWDDYETIWKNGDYEFDSEIKSILTATLSYSDGFKDSVLVFTENNNLYRSALNGTGKIEKDPEIYGQNLSSEIQKLGLTVNTVQVFENKIMLNTNLGSYEVTVDADALKVVDVDTTDLVNIVKLVKLYDTALSSEIFALKRSDHNGLLGYDGKTTHPQFAQLSHFDITNIHSGNNCYYVFGSTGISSIENINSELVDYDERLSGTYVKYLVGENKYYLDNGINQFDKNLNYSLSGFVNIGISPDFVYQYDDTNIYIKNGNKLYTYKMYSDTNEVKYNGKSVSAEYQNFRFVRTEDGLFYNGNLLKDTSYTKNTDLYYDEYLKYGTNTIHNFIVDNTYYMEKTASSSNSPFKITNVEGLMLVACSDGWYLYSDKTLTKIINASLYNKKAPFSINQGRVNRFSGAVENVYTFILNGNEVYQFDLSNLSWTKLFTVDKGNINTMNVASDYKYLFGTQSNGLWYTFYDYEMVNHISSPEKSEITRRVNAVYDLSVANHIAEYHTDHDGKVSTVKYINENMLPVDFYGISSDWKKETKTTDNYVIVDNDIVDSVKFESVQNPIKVEVMNGFTDYEYTEISGITFIYKNWTSGQKELYVNIPTTNTYYTPHLSGLNYCRNYQEDMVRENTGLSSVSDIGEDSTSIKVTVTRKFFDNVRNFSDVMIEGQSLPLKIYRDRQYDCVGSQNYFHSTIKKSVFCKKVHETDSIVLYFKCFGTDEQALKLMGF